MQCNWFSKTNFFIWFDLIWTFIGQNWTLIGHNNYPHLPIKCWQQELINATQITFQNFLSNFFLGSLRPLAPGPWKCPKLNRFFLWVSPLKMDSLNDSQECLHGSPRTNFLAEFDLFIEDNMLDFVSNNFLTPLINNILYITYLLLHIT